VAGFEPGAKAAAPMTSPRVRALLRSPRPEAEWHSGELETAFMLAVDRRLVRTRIARRLPPAWFDFRGALVARGISAAAGQVATATSAGQRPRVPGPGARRWRSGASSSPPSSSRPSRTVPVLDRIGAARYSERIQIEEMGGNPRGNSFTTRTGRPTLMASILKI